MSSGELPPDVVLYAEEILRDAQELDLYRAAQFRAILTFVSSQEPHLELKYGTLLREGIMSNLSPVDPDEATAQLKVFSEQSVVPMMQHFASQVIELAAHDAAQRPDWFREHCPQYDHAMNGNVFTGGQLALEAYFTSTPESYLAVNVQAARLADGELYSQSVNFVEADPEIRRLTQISQCGDRPLHVLVDIVPNVDNTLADITRYFSEEYDDQESGARLASVAKGNLGALTKEQLAALRADFQRRYSTDATVQMHVATALDLYEAERQRIANQYKNPDDELIDWDTLARCHRIVEQLAS